MRKLFVVLSVIFLGIGLIASVYCATPGKIKYQGVLKFKGELLSGEKSMEFKIYDAPSDTTADSGNLCWDSGAVDVKFEQGLFDAILSPVLAAGRRWEDGPYYLEVSIGSGSDAQTLSPREEINSTVYALQAGGVDDGVITAPKIANGAVGDLKISSVSWTKIYGAPAPGTSPELLQVQQDTGTLRTALTALALSTGTISSSGDNLGNHIATTTLNMSGFDITNIGNGNYDISAQFALISASTVTINATKLDISSAALTYLFKTEKAADSALFDGHLVTDFLTGTDLTQLKVDTGTLRTDINAIVLSTGSFLHLSGGTMAGAINMGSQNITNVGTINTFAVVDPATKLDANGAITGATKTKITYDAKGLVTAGADATTADIAASTDRNYVTDAQAVVIGNTTGINSGDETQATLKTKLGAANTGADGYLTSGDWNTFNGKQATLTAGTDYLTPTGSGSGLTGIVAAGDNLGNHIATTTLNMAGNNITGVGTINTFAVVDPDTKQDKIVCASTAVAAPELLGGNAAWADIPDVSVTFTVSKVPAVVFAYYTGAAQATNAASCFLEFQFTLDGTAFGHIGYGSETDFFKCVALVSTYPIDSTGSHTITVQKYSAANAVATKLNNLVIYVMPQ